MTAGHISICCQSCCGACWCCVMAASNRLCQVELVVTTCPARCGVAVLVQHMTALRHASEQHHIVCVFVAVKALVFDCAENSPSQHVHTVTPQTSTSRVAVCASIHKHAHPGAARTGD